MRSLKAIAVLASTCVLAACGNPTVRFEQAKGPDLTGAAKYQFLASSLEFGRLKPADPPAGAAAPAAPAKPAENSIAMTVVPVPDPSRVYYLTGKDWSQAWGVSTSLSSAYSKTNPSIMESIGTETTDKRKEIIASVGGLIVAAAPLAIGLLNKPVTDGLATDEQDAKKPINFALPPDLPLVKLLPDVKNQAKPGDCTLLYDHDGADAKTQEERAKREQFEGGSFAIATRCRVWLDADTKWQIGDFAKAVKPLKLEGHIEFGPVRESAISRVEFDKTPSRDSSVMFYSACRTVTLTIDKVRDANDQTLKPIQTISMTGMIADPNWVETAKLLYKGTITLLTPCGVTVGEEKGAAPNPAEAATELFKQYKAVKDAYKPPAK